MNTMTSFSLFAIAYSKTVVQADIGLVLSETFETSLLGFQLDLDERCVIFNIFELNIGIGF